MRLRNQMRNLLAFGTKECTTMTRVIRKISKITKLLLFFSVPQHSSMLEQPLAAASLEQKASGVELQLHRQGCLDIRRDPACKQDQSLSLLFLTLSRIGTLPQNQKFERSCLWYLQQACHDLNCISSHDTHIIKSRAMAQTCLIQNSSWAFAPGFVEEYPHTIVSTQSPPTCACSWSVLTF